MNAPDALPVAPLVRRIAAELEGAAGRLASIRVDTPPGGCAALPPAMVVAFQDIDLVEQTIRCLGGVLTHLAGSFAASHAHAAPSILGDVFVEDIRLRLTDEGVATSPATGCLDLF